MKKLLQIGKKIFNYKKDALSHYKKILNSYDFGEYLTANDFEDVLALLKIHPRAKEKIGTGIKQFRIAKLQHNTKCFEFVRVDSTSGVFGYGKCINGEHKSITKFSRACRNTIQQDLRNVKLEYFKQYSKKGRAKCQETGELLLYKELCVDHRQPNTFSVIVDRFIELYNIDIENIDYLTDNNNTMQLLDLDMANQFKKYHKEKSSLRLVKKKLNASRSYQARISTQKKDLKIT